VRDNISEFQSGCNHAEKCEDRNRNDWGAVCYVDGEFYRAPTREKLEIFDRIGGGDSFASGLIYGFLTDKGPQYAVDCGAAHGALAMTTPGDTTMATLAEVEKLMKVERRAWQGERPKSLSQRRG